MSTDPWDLVMAGKWEAALGAYKEDWHVTHSAVDLHNRALVLLNLGRHAEALADLERCLILSKANTDGDFQYIGAVHWLMGNQRDAFEWWQSSLKAGYTSWIARSPALLVYAGARLGYKWLEKDGLQLLKKLWKPGKDLGWPSALPGMYLGEVPTDEPETYVSTTPVLRERQLCQALFHTGVIALRSGNTELANSRFRRAASLQEAVLEVELYLARGEVAGL